MARNRPLIIRLAASHPFLLRGALIGIAVAVALWLVPNTVSGHARALLSWDAGAGAFIGWLLWAKRNVTSDIMRARAAEQDEGRHIMLWLCVLAAAAAIFAIWQELAAASQAPEASRAWGVALAFLTIAVSWLFMHTVFASHYAHEFFMPDQSGAPAGGLEFPGREEPDFWDFFHFALVIGVAAQTADIAISSKRIRRTVTMHGIVAFLFNTVVLAMSINFAASLFA